MKIKELFEAEEPGFWGQVARGLVGRATGRDPATVDAAFGKFKSKPQDVVQDPKDKIQDPKATTTSTDSTPPQPKQFAQGANPNANLNSKIAYMKKQGWEVSGKLTKADKQYIDSVDVYVDPNKFVNASADQALIKPSKPPHNKNYQASVTVPIKAYMNAIGREWTEGGNMSFSLTPAGWWSDSHQRYVNPNHNLDDVITGFQKK